MKLVTLPPDPDDPPGVLFLKGPGPKFPAQAHRPQPMKSTYGGPDPSGRVVLYFLRCALWRLGVTVDAAALLTNGLILLNATAPNGQPTGAQVNLKKPLDLDALVRGLRGEFDGLSNHALVQAEDLENYLLKAAP